MRKEIFYARIEINAVVLDGIDPDIETRLSRPKRKKFNEKKKIMSIYVTSFFVN